MIVNCDVKSLEVVVAAELSDDKVLKTEIRDKLDLHALNQKKFSLPSRVVAKRFIFKLLYGATAFGYAQDSDFLDVGFSAKQWQKVIDEFYNKYVGIAAWHEELVKTVRKTGGILEIPSGRFYQFEQKQTPWGPKWPLTQIKNYPVQGWGADLVMLGRIEAYRQFIEAKIPGEFIQTIHDSIVYDVPDEYVDQTAKILAKSIAIIPELCYNNWGWEFSLPMTSEIQVGKNKKDLVEYKQEK